MKFFALAAPKIPNKKINTAKNPAIFLFIFLSDRKIYNHTARIKKV
jgi:hypothetical protein